MVANSVPTAIIQRTTTKCRYGLVDTKLSKMGSTTYKSIIEEIIFKGLVISVLCLLSRTKDKDPSVLE